MKTIRRVTLEYTSHEIDECKGVSEQLPSGSLFSRVVRDVDGTKARVSIISPVGIGNTQVLNTSATRDELLTIWQLFGQVLGEWPLSCTTSEGSSVGRAPV